MAALEPGVTTVIDLTLTTFWDSAGLGKIAVARRLACAYHIDLRVVVPTSCPWPASSHRADMTGYGRSIPASAGRWPRRDAGDTRSA